MGAVSSAVPPELILRFLRDQIAGHRDRAPKLREGALTFAVVRRDGLTDYWTIFIRRDDVALENGAAPIQYKGPLAVVYADEGALSDLTRGGDLTGIDADGDAALLKAVAPCFGEPIDLLSLRAKK